MSAPSPGTPAPARARFGGSGAEYFRIWIVNVALTLATLGIYSAWAKVRREQYFHRHTSLSGAGFDSSEASQAIAVATSAGLPSRPRRATLRGSPDVGAEIGNPVSEREVARV